MSGEHESVAGIEEGVHEGMAEIVDDVAGREHGVVHEGMTENADESGGVCERADVGGRRERRGERRRRRPSHGDSSARARQLSSSDDDEGSPAKKMSRRRRFTIAENMALVSAVNIEKKILFTNSVSTQQKAEAWRRVRDEVGKVGEENRNLETIRKRYYDCRTSVLRCIRQEKTLNEWQLEFKRNLMPEVQSAGGPPSERTGQHLSLSDSESTVDQPSTSARSIGHNQKRLHSPVLSLSSVEKNVEQEDIISPTDDHRQQLSPIPSTVPMDSYISLQQENRRLGEENSNLVREMRRLTSTMIEIHQKERADLKALLVKNHNENIQAMEKFSVDFMSTIDSLESRLPYRSRISSSSSNTP